MALQADRASVRFRHEGADLDLRASASPIEAASGRRRVAVARPGSRSKANGGGCRSRSAPPPGRRSPSSRPARRSRCAASSPRAAPGSTSTASSATSSASRSPMPAVALAAPSLAPFAAFIESPRRDPAHDPRRRDGEGRRRQLRPGACRRHASARPISPASSAGSAASSAAPLRAHLKSDSTDLADLRWLGRCEPSPRARSRPQRSPRRRRAPGPVRSSGAASMPT